MKKLFFILVVLICAANQQLTAQNISLEEGMYYSGNGNLYTGTYTAYFDSGKKKSVIEIVAGRANGKAIYFYETGAIMEKGSFVNNEKDGEWLRWDEAGQKIAEAVYANGKKDGTWYVWDSNGIKRYEMFYTMGAKKGTWVMWDEKGNVTSQKSYDNL